MLQFSDRGLPAPDIVLHLDISVDAATKRGSFSCEDEREDFEELQRELTPPLPLSTHIVTMSHLSSAQKLHCPPLHLRRKASPPPLSSTNTQKYTLSHLTSAQR